VIEVDGKQISGKTEGKNAVVSLVEDTKKVSILKNKIVEVDTPTNNVRLYTDEIPKFNPSNKVFGQLVGELKKTTKLNDDVTIIDFTNKTFPTQPVEQLEQAPVTITQGSITRNYVPLNNRIVDFDTDAHVLLYNPTVELYEKVVADYEKQLSSTTDEVLKKNIQSKLDDVKNSFTVTYEQTGQSQESENKDLTNSVDSLMKVVLESNISDKIKNAIERQITTIISEINNNEKDNVNKKLRTLSGLITPTKNENAISELSKIINICNPT
jgi:hypothetical protein